MNVQLQTPSTVAGGKRNSAALTGITEFAHNPRSTIHQACRSYRYRPLPTLERLNHVFHQDSDYGWLVSKVKRGTLQRGNICGTKHQSGCVQVYVDNVAYRAHRVAWKLSYGRDPKGPLKHINGDRSDNRISNLREVVQ